MTHVKRAGIASFLFQALHPWSAQAATVFAEYVTCRFTFKSCQIPLGDVKAVNIRQGFRYATLTLRHGAGTSEISGLFRHDAQVFTETLESARADWWRRTLASQIALLRSIHDRVSELGDPPKYVHVEAIRNLANDAQSAAGGLVGRWPDSLADEPEIRMLMDILRFLESPDEARTNANEAYVANELARSQALFDTIEAQPLTDEQRRAVASDDRRNLVVAAAGSGKTSVIVAKAGWLIRKGYRRPSELLLLTFARDARNEMDGRIRKRLGVAAARSVTVRTFHSLGMYIIGQAGGRRPALARVAESDRVLFDLIRQIVADLLVDGEVSGKLLEWFRDQFAPYKSKHEFANWGEYWDYIRSFDIRSLKGEQVKSYEECEIANFLYLNGVAYKYEAAYEHDTATSQKRQYQPDFYLPKHGIYIEHFGLDADGRTAPFIDAEEYRREMDWKRQLHAERGTTLIETFSHEHATGKLFSNLEKKLVAYGVTFSPMTQEDLFAVLETQGKVDPFTRLLATFLQHFKGARLSFDEIAQRAEYVEDPRRARAFLEVFRPVYERYQATLAQSEAIDFHDMINRATDLVESGRYRSPFGYILVDEFQDISPSRARLLKALLDAKPDTQLFAVGDDWQAIYRFGGSDIAIMREFDSRFGNYQRIDLETMFRTCDHIASVATDFVLRNPSQIEKKVRPIHKADGPVVHLGLPAQDVHSLLGEALDRIAEHAEGQEGTSTVLLLGRYRHLKPRNMGHLARRYPRLRFTYMTVHRSKGLEADYVVILGLRAGKYGFPAEIADDPLLDLVLSAPESHPNAEERRLLYVAITRARRQSYLLADGGPPSAFAQELIRGDYDIKVFGRLPESDVPCPQCKGGRLERRENRSGTGIFFGCSNFPYCKHTMRPCPLCGTGLLIKTGKQHRCRDCREALEPCPDCSGWLEIRMGRYGRFMGCSNWPACDYTRNLKRPRSPGRSHGHPEN
ncbi:MAG: UvrD-helicase domain-containing protein [Caldilineaceae bacterium]|nr:UvrD-helicase domain-containing protein [Caldilineaceae bacterium]MDE0455168.1 UvrD-helicase domain-containing protein [Gammaproteobacteria bacterium]